MALTHSQSAVPSKIGFRIRLPASTTPETGTVSGAATTRLVGFG